MNSKLLIFSIILSSAIANAQISPDHLVSEDKGDIKAFVGNTDLKGERKVYKGDELLTIGMPVGGICAGQLYVRGDGTLANWWIANNAYNTGYGVDSLLDFDTPSGPWHVCYQTFEPLSYIDQGFTLSVDGKDYELSRKDFDDISFTGEYPIAYVDYARKKGDLPVSVSAEFYSPFVPLDARRSGTPATIMEYTVRNTSNGDVDVKLTGRMQNLVCIDLKDRATGVLRNKVVDNGSVKSVFMDMQIKNIPPAPQAPSKRKPVMFDNFESGTYAKWTPEGEAFSTRPAPGELGNQDRIEGVYGRFLANSYLNSDVSKGKLTSTPFKICRKYITFNISGGSHKRTTCMNLLVDGKVVLSAEGNNNEDFLPRNWDVSEYQGRTAVLEIVDDEIGDWGHISVDNIEFTDTPIPMPGISISEDHAYFGNLALSVFDPEATAEASLGTGKDYAEDALGNKLVGGLASSIRLAPGESRTIRYALTWYFPNRPLSYKGSEWNRPLPPNSPAIGNMYSNWFDSSMDVADFIFSNYESLSADTHTFHDAYYIDTTIPYWLANRIMMSASILASETCQWWANDKFWAWEGVGSCEGTCTHVWGYAQAMAALFPELERNLREKTDYSVSLQPDGGIMSRNGEHGILIDGHASVILRMYREHLMSRNNYFLSRNWDKVKLSLDYIIGEDGPEPDGLIVKTQPNTYDISFNGANTYVGGLYLAALRAGEQMALIMKDTLAAKRYKEIYEAGSRGTMDRLWNGEYFYQDVDEKEYPKFQYGKGCLADQLFGQTWASLLRLGDIYPADAEDKALHSVWKYNWARDVKDQTEAHLPERYYAHSGEPGLLICTWPHSKHPGEDGVRYRDEVWTGIEYQVATGMIEKGMVDEGLAIVRGVDSRYDGAKHNPWNEIECGDHYARAMASYGVLHAIQGYWYDGPRGVMAFDPKIAEDGITGFFTSAEGWGNLSQERTSEGQKNTVSLKYGRLSLNAFQLRCNGTEVHAMLNGTEIPVSVQNAGELKEIVFEGLKMNADDELVITID